MRQHLIFLGIQVHPLDRSKDAACDVGYVSVRCGAVSRNRDVPDLYIGHLLVWYSKMDQQQFFANIAVLHHGIHAIDGSGDSRLKCPALLCHQGYAASVDVFRLCGMLTRRQDFSVGEIINGCMRPVDAIVRCPVVAA